MKRFAFSGAWMLGVLLTTSVPGDASEQRATAATAATAAFQDNYADVNGMRLHYAKNPAQRYASNYFFIFNGYLAPGEQPVDETNNKETATRRAHTGFVDAEVKAGRYTENDRQAWIDAWSQPGSTTAGLNYYRANHRNPPFNDRHPAASIPFSWSAKEVTAGATSTIIKTPTLVIWGLKDTSILSSHLSGLEKWVPNVSVRLYPDDDHWVMLEKHTAVAQDIRRFVDGKDFPKESVYRADVR